MTSLSHPIYPARPPRTADLVLYLDLDGVVQHEAVYWSPKRGVYMHQGYAPGHKLFEWLPILERLLEPFPEVALVLSSSWCVHPGYSRTIRRFPESLQKRFIGGTFHRRAHGSDPWQVHSFRATPRGVQIWADVLRRKPRQWLALDDDTFSWPVWARDNLVACDGETGLSCPRVQEELTAKLLACRAALSASDSSPGALARG